jgi:hypothetical protein
MVPAATHIPLLALDNKERPELDECTVHSSRCNPDNPDEQKQIGCTAASDKRQELLATVVTIHIMCRTAKCSEASNIHIP